MNPFVALLDTVIYLIWLAVLIWFVMSMLIQFNIINRWQPLVSRVYGALESLLTPILRPIQRIVPTFNGVDFSPLILILALQFVRNSIQYYF